MRKFATLKEGERARSIDGRDGGRPNRGIGGGFGGDEGVSHIVVGAAGRGGEAVAAEIERGLGAHRAPEEGRAANDVARFALHLGHVLTVRCLFPGRRRFF